mgnify:CR=1 FL=1
MELTFLGTGGCRFNMVKQIRQTGGFILKDGDFMLSVDPGPGALVYANQNGFDLEELTAVFVSHAHLDHEGDVEPMIEAMTRGCLEDRGILISNSDYLDSNHVHSSLSNYHREAVNEKVWAEQGSFYEFGNGFRMYFEEVVHGGIDTTGFKLDYGEKTVSWIPDTNSFEGLIDKFRDSDYLIISCARPHDMEWATHLDLSDALKLVNEIDPEKAFITHIGVNFTHRMDEELEWLREHRKKDNIVIAEDNMTYEL